MILSFTYENFMNANIKEIKKPAVVVPRSCLPDVADGQVRVLAVPPNIFLLPYEIADRVGPESCETNPQLQQIIPYIVLRNEHGQLFVYSRGKGGAEDRLKAKLSIGLGGHVDSLPSSSDELLSAWLTAEAHRELEEEVGYITDEPLFFCGLILDRLKVTEDDGSVYVGQVHAGLLAIVEVAKTDVTKLEDGIIENGEWMSLEQLAQADIHSRLEPWSQAALSFLTK